MEVEDSLFIVIQFPIDVSNHLDGISRQILDSFRPMRRRVMGIFIVHRLHHLRKLLRRRRQLLAREELEELDGKIHEKFEDYLKAAIDICKAVEEEASNGGKDLVESLKSRWSKINSIRKKLRDDPEVFEELRG